MSGHYPPIKPGSITAVQVIAWIKVGLLSLAVCGLLAIFSQARAHAEVAALVTVLLVVFGAFAFAYAVIAVNIAKGHNWARIMAIVVEAINLASIPFMLGNLNGAMSGGSIIGVILSIVVIACASQSESRRYCREMPVWTASARQVSVKPDYVSDHDNRHTVD